MKNTFILCTVFSLVIALISGCADQCANVDCNTGTRVECDCDCPAEFEGLNCDLETREKFIGFWNTEAQCGNGTDVFTFDITKGTGLLDIELRDNITGQSYPAAVDGDQFTVPNTLIEFPVQSFYIEGNGEIDISGVITMNLKFTYVIGPEIDCTYALTK